MSTFFCLAHGMPVGMLSRPNNLLWCLGYQDHGMPLGMPLRPNNLFWTLFFFNQTLKKFHNQADPIRGQVSQVKRLRLIPCANCNGIVNGMSPDLGEKIDRPLSFSSFKSIRELKSCNVFQVGEPDKVEILQICPIYFY